MSQLDLFTGQPVVCNVEKDPTKSGLEAMEDKLLKKYVEKVSVVIDYIEDIGLPKKTNNTGSLQGGVLMQWSLYNTSQKKSVSLR